MYARNSHELGTTLETVDRVSRAVGMELGLRKCAVAHIRKGRYVAGEDYLLPEERKIECVSSAGTYRYLGVEQVFKPDHKAIRARLKETYAKRLYQIWLSSLSSRHKSTSHQHLGCCSFSLLFCTGQMATIGTSAARSTHPEGDAQI